MKIDKLKCFNMKTKEQKRVEKLADKMIKEMEDFGYKPDEMLEIIRLAKKKYNKMKINKPIKN